MSKRIVLPPLIMMALLISMTSRAQIISVQGTGTVEIEAEFATLAASVIVDAQTAALAQTGADTKMAALLTAIEIGTSRGWVFNSSFKQAAFIRS